MQEIKLKVNGGTLVAWVQECEKEGSITAFTWWADARPRAYKKKESGGNSRFFLYRDFSKPVLFFGHINRKRKETEPMVKCPHCGGEVEYLPGTKIIQCQYCDSKFAPEDLREEKQILAEEHPSVEEETTYEAKEFICPQCGGSILSTEEAAVTFCSYCGSQVALQSRLVHMRKPDRIIPFQIGTDECKKAYQNRVGKALFAPSSMKKDLQISKFRGIYMPYWVYSVKARNEIAMMSQKSHQSGNYEVTEFFDVTLHTGGSVDGITYDAAASFSDELSQGIAPYDMTESEPFDTAYLSSFYADKGDVEMNTYREEAQDIAAQKAGEFFLDNEMKRAGVTSQHIRDAFTPAETEGEMSYLPVWFLAVKNKKGDRVSYAAVNGQTGKTSVDLPVDFLKYLVGSLILAVPAFLLLTMIATITPTVLSIIVMVLSLIITIMTGIQLDTVFVREMQLDDKGQVSAESLYWAKREGKVKVKKRKKGTPGNQTVGSNIFVSFAMIPLFLIAGMILERCIGVAEGKAALWLFLIWLAIFVIRLVTCLAAQNRQQSLVEIKAPFRYKLKTIWKPLAGILACGIVMIIYPVNDLYYYLSDIVAIFLAGWTALDLIRGHNKLTLRKLPQFGKRGGDEREY